MVHEPASDPVLGAVVSSYGAGWKLRLLAFFLIAIFAGIALLAAGSPQSGSGSALVAVVVVTLALIGLVQYFGSASKLVLFEHGIESSGRFGSKRIAWRDLDGYELQIVDSMAAAGAGAGGLVGGLLAHLVSRAMKPKEQPPNAVWLFGKDGTKIVLSAKTKGFEELTRTLVPSLADRLFAALKPAYDAGSEIAFGKKVTLERGVGITVKGLFGKPQVLPLEQAASAAVERGSFVIRRSDTNAAWQTLLAGSLRNPGVLQKFVEVLGRRHDEAVPMAWTNYTGDHLDRS